MASVDERAPLSGARSRAGRLHPRQRLGKYRLQGLIARGGFADVYRAVDTIEGVPVALKIPAAQHVSSSLIDDFRREVRLTARLDHPNVLGIKNADFVDGWFVVASPLGIGTLSDEIGRRLKLDTLISYAGQMLAAVAHAHENRVLHCDLKPDNFILFRGGRLRLGDFGIARIAQKTMAASGSGTVGYLAPEHALGRPSFRSDVFSLGLILFEMLAGKVPEWPFAWPPRGYERAVRRVHPEWLALIERSLRVDQYGRFDDAVHMRSAFERLAQRGRLARPAGRPRRSTRTRRDWRAVRTKEFARRFGKALGLSADCPSCGGRIAEPMQACPWCGEQLASWPGETRFPDRCGRCARGRKLDWKSCAWCYGPGFDEVSNRSYSDVRYVHRCASCRGPQMPFMRYCPWCRTKVRRSFRLEGSRARCPRCSNGVALEYWSHCAWCSASLAGARR